MRQAQAAQLVVEVGPLLEIDAVAGSNESRQRFSGSPDDNTDQPDPDLYVGASSTGSLGSIFRSPRPYSVDVSAARV